LAIIGRDGLKEIQKKQKNLLWVHPNYNSSWCESIIKEFNIHPIIAQVLVSRGFSTFEDIYHYLYAKLPNLHSPDLFVGMDKAVHRIVRAVHKGEHILIYGDNDVDGITGTTLLVEFLRKIGAEVYYYIPYRTFSNLSMSDDALKFAILKNCTLLITVDCAFPSDKGVEKILNKNIDLIITDHHEPVEKIPHCIAHLNPKLSNNSYPNRELTGVGVAFKLAHSIINYLVSEETISATAIDLKEYLDLVALGTIADMGALIGENRILVRYGLKQFANTERIGFLNLMKTCKIKPCSINTFDITSKIAPRLNSLGRITDPVKGVEFMLMRDMNKAQYLVKDLEKNNIHRQQIERCDTNAAEDFIHNHSQILENKAIVLHSSTWHPGIISIIAARISKQYNRPALIIAVDNDIGRGSVRTIPEFPILSILRKGSDFLMNFGGHDFAAGFVIKKENILKFKKFFIKNANRILHNTDILPKLYLDSRVQFEDLTFEFLDSMQLLEPHGAGNPPPMFYADVTQIWPPKVVGKMHLKLYLKQNERILEGLGLNLIGQRTMLNKKDLKLQIAFTPYVNTFLNKSSIQLLIKDIKIK